MGFPATQPARNPGRAEGYVSEDLVFTNPNGRPMKPETLSPVFPRFRVAHKLRARFHDLRHTHATLMLKANRTLKAVSKDRVPSSGVPA